MMITQGFLSHSYCFLFIVIICWLSVGKLYTEEYTLINSQIEELDSTCLILTLPKAISQALNFNRSLLGTMDALVQSKYGMELADREFDIQFTPNSRAGYVGGGKAGTGLSMGGGIDVSKKFVTGTEFTLSPSLLKAGKYYHPEVRAIISQPLLRGLGKEYQLSNILGSQFMWRKMYRHVYMSQVQLILRTIQSLYEVVKAEKSLLLNQESHERIRLFYQAAKLKEKIGLSDALDVYRAEIELRHAEENLTNAQERLQETEDVLRDLLALSLETCLKVDVPLVFNPNSLSLQEAIQLALEHRIEIDQAEDQWLDNSRLSRLAKKNIYPEVNLVLDYTNCGRHEIFTQACHTRHRESTWGIGLTTSANFDPFAEKIAYEQSLIALETASRGVEQTKSTVILEVKKAMRLLQRAYERIYLQEEQIKTAQGELSLAKVKFDRGLADNFNVIQAEKTLRSAQQAYWSALIEHIVGEFQLLATLGLLIDKPHILK